jgi:proteinaceous RNase P
MRAHAYHPRLARRFVEWSAKHGPFDTIIDGANVGMFNQNFEDAMFNFNQVEKMLAQLRSDRGPDAKPVLLVLHQRRVRGGPANANNAVRLIQSWRANSAFMRASHSRRLAHVALRGT